MPLAKPLNRPGLIFAIQILFSTYFVFLIKFIDLLHNICFLVFLQTPAPEESSEKPEHAEVSAVGDTNTAQQSAEKPSGEQSPTAATAMGEVVSHEDFGPIDSSDVSTPRDGKVDKPAQEQSIDKKEESTHVEPVVQQGMDKEEESTHAEPVVQQGMDKEEDSTHAEPVVQQGMDKEEDSIHAEPVVQQGMDKEEESTRIEDTAIRVGEDVDEEEDNASVDTAIRVSEGEPLHSKLSPDKSLNSDPSDSESGGIHKLVPRIDNTGITTDEDIGVGSDRDMSFKDKDVSAKQEDNMRGIEVDMSDVELRITSKDEQHVDANVEVIDDVLTPRGDDATTISSVQGETIISVPRSIHKVTDVTFIIPPKPKNLPGSQIAIVSPPPIMQQDEDLQEIVIPTKANVVHGLPPDVIDDVLAESDKHTSSSSASSVQEHNDSNMTEDLLTGFEVQPLDIKSIDKAGQLDDSLHFNTDDLILPELTSSKISDNKMSQVPSDLEVEMTELAPSGGYQTWTIPIYEYDKNLYDDEDDTIDDLHRVRINIPLFSQSQEYKIKGKGYGLQSYSRLDLLI